MRVFKRDVKCPRAKVMYHSSRLSSVSHFKGCQANDLTGTRVLHHGRHKLTLNLNHLSCAAGKRRWRLFHCSCRSELACLQHTSWKGRLKVPSCYYRHIIDRVSGCHQDSDLSRSRLSWTYDWVISLFALFHTSSESWVTPKHPAGS